MVTPIHRIALATAASLGFLSVAPATHAAPIAALEAGVHFFNGTVPGYDRETVLPVGAVGPETATVTGSFGPGAPTRIDAAARAAPSSLGVRLTTELAGASVSASIFEGVRFATSRIPTTANTLAGYSIGLAGTLTATVEQNQLSFGPLGPGAALAPGDPLLGFSRLTLTQFDTLADRGAALRGSNTDGSQRIIDVRTAGPVIARSFATAPTTPPPAGQVYSEVRVFIGNVALDRCIGLCDVVAPLPATVTSFGVGLALTATLSAEIGTYGEIDAFSSFDLEGLVMYDPEGNPVEGVFRSDSGTDLTVEAYRDPNIILQDLDPTPIPLPAGAWLLPMALGALTFLRRRRPVV